MRQLGRRLTITIMSAVVPLLYALGALAETAPSAAPTAAPTAQLEEIVITAQRRAENLSDVPISVSAFSQEQLDAQGVRSVDDIARLTPGVVFTRADPRNGEASNIAIRGISSTAGASTTGIYIDDTPIQSRSLGYSSFNTFPAIFDLDRVEVLRGPQGTLFGAGSEGGTVRFITPQPSLVKTSGYVRSELAHTEGGAPSYEGGAAIGGPIIDDMLGFRVSAWYRMDGGWVDRTDWDRTTLTPFNTLDRGSNWQTTSVVKAALAYAPADHLTITPSVYYQRLELNDTPSFWASLSNPNSGVFDNGNSLSAYSTDQFYLSALKVDWGLGAVRLLSNTSYFNRRNAAINDYAAFEAGLWAHNPYYPPGYYAPAFQGNQQSNFTEELRLQSDDDNARLKWVLGVFFANARQTSEERVQDTQLPALFQAVTGVPFNVVFGQGLVDGLYTDVNDPVISRDKQSALFGQADFKATDKLTLTAGLRASKTEVDASGKFAGPVVGPTVNDAGSQSERPVTPKAGMSYKFDSDNMLYATAAKGFRIGGYNPRVGLPCGPELASLGLNAAPKLFDSDSVWSYELGSKNALLDNRLRLDSSVYYIDWKNIQQNVALNSCGFQFIANLGAATSKGFDIQAQMAVTSSVLLSLAVGYTDAVFNQTVKGGPLAATNLVTSGDHLIGSPWTAALSAAYRFTAFGGRDSFARLDYQFQSKQDQLFAGGGQAGASTNDPANGAYTPSNLFGQPQTSLLSARIGTRWSGIEVSLFANNLLDSHTLLSQGGTPVVAPGEATVLQQTTFRPRTIGITGTYRY